MSRFILIIAGGAEGHIFGSGLTPATRALACTENVAELGGTL